MRLILSRHYGRLPVYNAVSSFFAISADKIDGRGNTTKNRGDVD